MDVEAFIRRFGAGLAALEGLALDAARQRYDSLCAGFAPPDPVEMTTVDSRLDAVPVRCFRPADARPGRLIYCHGGGWLLGGDVYKVILTLISVAALPVAVGVFALGTAFVVRVLPERASAKAPAG